MKRVLAAAMAWCLAIGAQAQPATPPFNADAVVQRLEQLISTRYVHLDRRPGVVERLERSRRAGRYAVTDPHELATRVTEDLREVTQDGHMSLSYQPSSGPQSAVLRPRGDRQDAERVARRINHGLLEMRILEGNVRYLRVAEFAWVPNHSARAWDDAMRFLSDGDAVIVDLRGVPGGSSEGVRYFVSHFMAPNVHLMTFQDDQGRPEQSRTLAELPAGRMIGKPLYVLIDRGSASAAEEAASHVQLFRLGELVGERTPGAANNNELMPVGGGFIASISVYSPRHAVSGSNWERVGVQPTIAAPPPQAREVAYVHALERLHANATGPDQQRYAWSLVSARAAVQRPQVAPETLARFAGVYGERRVRLADGALIYEREGQPSLTLRPLGGALFEPVGFGGLRLRFDPEGAPARYLEVLRPDGTASRSERTL